MSQEFDASANAFVNRDERGVVRDALHLEGPFVTSAATAQLAAQQYLERFHALFGISSEELRALGAASAIRPESAGVEYRFLAERSQFDTTTVVFSQTCLALPVWGGSMSVSMRRDPYRVISAVSTALPDVQVSAPSEGDVDRLLGITPAQLARALGLTAKDDSFDRTSLAIERRELFIYRFRKDNRLTLTADLTADAEPGSGLHHHHHQQPPLPPLPTRIVDGGDYLVAAVYFVLGVPDIPGLHWVALVEAETRSVLKLRAFVATVNGLVFTQDPITLAGGPSPAASDAALDPLRSSVLLRGLDPPAAGSYSLTGDLVTIKDVEPPPIAPPTEPAGTDFDFLARTDDFAAVNAYYHADRFFRVVHDFGFDNSVYFGGTLFPTVVDHRGDGGAVVNAHCLGNGAYGIQQTTFALADLSNVAQPLGIACDYRVVLHELAGHGTLYNHVNWPNFGFAHSAGDSVGVLLNDFDSKAPDRFMSFPWLYASVPRRQDRTPAAGWGWAGAIALNPFGALDGGGYNNEQILCTTHFRIYRSIGGDSPEQAVREFAGRYVAYLILRLIGGLTAPTNPPNATVYASDLIAADAGDWTAAGEVGGCYWKVIRWAFEKQGLYQPAATPKPNNNIGPPPPVDVYIDDGRNGEYPYVPSDGYYHVQRFWDNTEVWNRHHPDGGHEHQTPIVGVTNYAYARVRNRGTSTATSVSVRGWHSRPAAGLVWPDDWKPMTTPSLTIPSLASGAETIVGPFDWHPEELGHECMLIGASTAGDRANNDPVTGLPCATGPTPIWRLVPCDNNLGLRGLIPVPGGGGRDRLVEAFVHRHFWASNPFARPASLEVRAELPSLLSSRGWAITLDNPGGGSFTLGPRASRRISPRLISGQNFTAAEVQAAGRVAIEFVVLADGLVVGGLTYLLVPGMKEPARETIEHHDEHDQDSHEDHHHHDDVHGPRGVTIKVDFD